MKKPLLKKRWSALGMYVALLLSLLVVSSCASKNRLLSSWVDPTIGGTGQKIEDVLVIGVARDATIRRLYENSYARGLQREGVHTFTGHAVEAVKKTVNYDTVVQAAEVTKAKTVLITRLIDASTKSESSDSLGRMYGVLKDAPMDAMIMAAGTAQVSSTSTKVKLQLESLLYDVKTKKLLWSGIVEVTNPVMTNKYIDSATRLFIEDLQKNELL